MSAARIVIVDDSKTARKGVKLILSEIDAVFTEAENGRDALEKIAENPDIDLIITDVDMPVMDGIELCKHLKMTDATSAIPVVILSMFDSEMQIERGFEAGADAYVVKKNFQTALLPAVKQNLEKSVRRQNCLVMLVDDSRVVRLSIESFLVEQGFQVVTAENGKEALSLMEVKKPDICVSDYEMPVMDGLSFCRAIKAKEEYRDIPFVVMSVHDDQGKMKRFIQNGAAAYITKPFNFNELSILIDKIISDHFQILLRERERLEVERSSMLASIASLVEALEARDAYTRGHSEAVAKLVCDMLSFCGASDKELETAFVGGRLHDIGKIGVRDEILFSVEKLTDDDWVQIKKHPVIGAQILQMVPCLGAIMPIVLHHHERYDGGGYPDGLKGKEIPYLARLTAVADTFSALTENRPYRDGMKKEKALLVVKEVSGTQLCPECTDIFFRLMEKKSGCEEC
ncbi:MAG: response regulator [Desulfobulbaceae bacterium]|nr:response regulator [Desulfobulbaceae bacterium]